jgi:lipopolysaccharide export system protein LptA
MRLSIQRLRWVLIAGALLLLLVLAAYIGYGRYRALQAYRRILAHSGVSITRDSNGVTYSQSIQGRKIFTIRAKSETSLGNGKWALHDAELFLYTRSAQNPDHIYGSGMEYDQNEGIARAQGQVFIDLQPPQGLAAAGHAAASPDQVIHIRTSGLVYLRKQGIAATEQQVDFSYRGVQCTAKGAEFDSDHSLLHLLADVQMDTLAHGKPMHVTATRADLDRDNNIANLAHPIATTDGRTGSSASAILNLRKDGSVERIQGIDNVVLTTLMERITASRLDAALSSQSVPETAHLSGNVLLTGTDPLRPMHGTANTVDIAFNPQGNPAKIVANGIASLSLIDRRSNPRGLNRSIQGATITTLFIPVTNPGKRKSSSQIRELTATGYAHASSESIATSPSTKPPAKTSDPQLKISQLWADTLHVLFTSTSTGKAEPQHLTGTGNTRLQQDAPLGAQQTSSGNTLEIAFNTSASSTTAMPGQTGLGISSAIQTGNVVIHDRAAAKPGSTEAPSVSDGTADRAIYDGSLQTLTLSGNAHFTGNNASVDAPNIMLDQRTQNADAHGGLQATMQNTPAPGSPKSASAPVTHILANSAHLEHATRLANFYGTDAQPAHMWQDASQIQAATLLFDGTKRTLSARTISPTALIHAVFVSVPKPGTASAKAASILRVSSLKMDYSDLQREAIFSTNVTLDNAKGQVTGDRAVVFLTPSSKNATQLTPSSNTSTPTINGSIDRAVISGAVVIDQPGRRGTGEQLLYTASTESYVLTGTPTAPPQIVDAQQGNVTGTTLVFSDSGSTIVVAGDSGTKSKSGRVRTETQVSPESRQ